MSRRPSQPSRRSPGRTLCLFAILAASLLVPYPATAQSELDGKTAGGAYYGIHVPAAWNGDLVIWNHGTDMDHPAPNPDLGPLVDIQLAEGFAVAASTYRQRGWALFKAAKDIKALVQVFRANFGEPRRVFVYGASLGGLVTVQAIEKANLGNVVGGLLWCGATGGSPLWDVALDLRLVYDAVCSDVPGAEIPGGARGLPTDTDFDAAAVETAVNVCTGVDLKKRSRSKGQKARLAQILDTVGGDERFLQTVMWYVTVLMADLVEDKGKLKGKLAVGNATVVYPNPEVDADIERVKPKKGAVRRLAKNYTPSGRIGNTKLLALHTDKDDLVFVENVGDYRDKLRPDQLVAAVAVEREPSHCGFTVAEGLASWESLLGWVNGAGQPAAADVQALCESIVELGLAAGPCRIDPAFEIGVLSDRILAR